MIKLGQIFSLKNENFPEYLKLDTNSLHLEIV